MMSRLRRAAEQLGHLGHETRRLNGNKWWRWSGVWFTEHFWAIASYRLSRSAYLALGRGWPIARVALAPVLFGLRPWSGRCEIHYRADLGRGLRILHPSLGVVISGKTVARENLVLVGGNCIGGRKGLEDKGIQIGRDVLIGVNAIVLGPITLGNGVQVGAGALVIHDAAEGEILLAPAAQMRVSRAASSGKQP